MSSFPFLDLPRVPRDEIFRNLPLTDLLNLMLPTKKVRKMLEMVRYPTHTLNVIVEKTSTIIECKTPSPSSWVLLDPSEMKTTDVPSFSLSFHGCKVIALKNCSNNTPTQLFAECHMLLAQKMLGYFRRIMPNTVFNITLKKLKRRCNNAVSLLPLSYCKKLIVEDCYIADYFQEVFSSIGQESVVEFKVQQSAFYVWPPPQKIVVDTFVVSKIMFLTRQHLLEIDVRHLNVFPVHFINGVDIDDFVENWRNGHYGKLKSLELGMVYKRNIVVKEAEETTRRPAVFRTYDNREIDCQDGVDYTRPDGTMATLIIKQNSESRRMVDVKFVVWEKSDLSTKRRRN